MGETDDRWTKGFFPPYLHWEHVSCERLLDLYINDDTEHTQYYVVKLLLLGLDKVTVLCYRIHSLISIKL